MSRFKPNGFDNSIELSGNSRQARLVGKPCDDIQSLIFLIEDLNASKRWFELALSASAADKDEKGTVSPETVDLTSGLYHAAITMYGKCFNETWGRTVRLTPEWVNAGLEDLHRKCLKHRNNLTAHPGNGDYERLDQFLVIQPDSEERINLSYVGHPAIANFDEPFAEAMIELIGQVLSAVKRRLDYYLEVLAEGFAYQQDAVLALMQEPDTTLNISIPEDKPFTLHVSHV